MLSRNVGEAAGDIRPSGENDTLDLGTDRRQRGTDIFATIEQRREPGRGNRLPCRRDKGAKPPRSDIAAGIRRAGQDDRAPGPGGRSQRSDGVVERMNKDDGIGGLGR